MRTRFALADGLVDACSMACIARLIRLLTAAGTIWYAHPGQASGLNVASIPRHGRVVLDVVVLGVELVVGSVVTTVVDVVIAG